MHVYIFFYYIENNFMSNQLIQILMNVPVWHVIMEEFASITLSNNNVLV